MLQIDKKRENIAGTFASNQKVMFHPISKTHSKLDRYLFLNVWV